jgi:hypothetical protein
VSSMLTSASMSCISKIIDLTLTSLRQLFFYLFR